MGPRCSETALAGESRDDTRPEQSYRIFNLSVQANQANTAASHPFGLLTAHRAGPSWCQLQYPRKEKEKASKARKEASTYLSRRPDPSAEASDRTRRGDGQVARPTLVELEQTGGGAVAGAGAWPWGGEEKRRGADGALCSGAWARHGQAGSGGPGIGCFRRGREGIIIGVAPTEWRVFLPARRAWRLAVRARLARARRPRFRSRDARGGPARAPVFKVVIIFLIFFY